MAPLPRANPEKPAVKIRIGFASANLHQEGEIIATASSSLKLVKIEGSQKDFLRDNIAKDAKIIKV